MSPFINFCKMRFILLLVDIFNIFVFTIFAIEVSAFIFYNCTFFWLLSRYTHNINFILIEVVVHCYSIAVKPNQIFSHNINKSKRHFIIRLIPFYLCYNNNEQIRIGNEHCFEGISLAWHSSRETQIIYNLIKYSAVSS